MHVKYPQHIIIGRFERKDRNLILVFTYHILQLSRDQGAVLPPWQKTVETCPVIYGPRIYYPASQEARDCFMANPEKYTNGPSPGPAVPIRLAIVGPPKSGKTTGTHTYIHVQSVSLSANKKILHICRKLFFTLKMVW